MESMKKEQDQQGKDKGISYMIKKRITGIIMAVVMLLLWIVQGWPLRIGFVAVMVISTWEMYSAFLAKGARPIRWIGIAYAVLVVPVYLRFGMQALMPLMTVCCMLGMAGVIIRGVRGGEIEFDSTVATIFPLLYPAALCTLVFPIMDLRPQLHATVALAMLLLVPLMNDLFAYEIGARFGKRPFAPVISPKKTIEGALSGLAASVIFSMIVPIVAHILVNYVPLFQPHFAPMPPLWFFALCGLMGGVAAEIGDLTASMVKRYCGIKDFGAIFPGHGGMLDRMDSVLFTACVIYVFFVVLW